MRNNNTSALPETGNDVVASENAKTTDPEAEREIEVQPPQNTATLELTVADGTTSTQPVVRMRMIMFSLN